MSHPKPQCGICAVLEAIRAGKAPKLIAELDNSYVVLGDAQFYRGYCILLSEASCAASCSSFRATRRARCQTNCARWPRRSTTVVKPLKLNYECLGNLEPHVHWHVFPRYESEEEKYAPRAGLGASGIRTHATSRRA